MHISEHKGKNVMSWNENVHIYSAYFLIYITAMETLQNNMSCSAEFCLIMWLSSKYVMDESNLYMHETSWLTGHN